MDWGESTAVLLANTIHTNQTSSQLSQKEERARELYQEIKQKVGQVTGLEIAKNAELYHKNIRDSMIEYGKYLGDQPVSEYDFCRVYSAFM